MALAASTSTLGPSLDFNGLDSNLDIDQIGPSLDIKALTRASRQYLPSNMYQPLSRPSHILHIPHHALPQDRHPPSIAPLDTRSRSSPPVQSKSHSNSALMPSTRPEPAARSYKATRKNPQSFQSAHEPNNHTHHPATANDSSDDEGSIPLLSAAAEELLGVKTGERPPASRAAIRDAPRLNHHSGSPLAHRRAVVIQSPAQTTLADRPQGNASPRVVRLSISPKVSTHLRRVASTSSAQSRSPLATEARSDLKTPASRPRSVLAQPVSSLQYDARPDRQTSSSKQHIVQQSGSAYLSSSQSNQSAQRSAAAAGSQSMGNSSALRSSTYLSPHATTSGEDEGLGRGISTSNRTRQQDDGAAQASIRIKRVGKVTGRFLSGPARRGMIRRHSEEEQSPSQMREAAPSPRDPREPAVEGDHASPNISSTAQQSPRQDVQPASPPRKALNPLPDSLHQHSRAAASPAPVYRIPLPHNLPIHPDQENIPPPTFKRNIASQNEKLALPAHEIIKDSAHHKAANGSPIRKALAPRNANTPLRPAPPPPPKMSVLETATATAGAASVSQSKRKRNYISVNGKLFTRMECIGRGGSGRVYRVMAENFKLFALKRVSLEDVDELAIRGFKGEIELLRKLERVERVVRLYDYEINDERKTLSVLMDIGELDLKKMLDPRLDDETGRFDVTFTRYIWQEMLECVQAVHQHDIVHSDLKPANFVLMQGQLKLIDFGIANAIQDDTVHVHREQQIGTPNYMAPETLLDANAGAGARPPGVHKLMKLGKPSDVWSLGCILYQIVYGRPPFGHLPSSHQKVLAICNFEHAIAFPAMGLGHLPVPHGLLRTLRRCLDRDPARRPTIEHLLSDHDPFLHPDTPAAPDTVPVSQELLARIQHNIIHHVREHGIPADADLATWPARFFASIKSAVDEGRA